MKGLGRHPQGCAAAAAVGIAAYVAVDVVLVFLRPHLSVLHNAESDYGSAGRYAWLMDLNFVLRCALSLAVVCALVAVADSSARLRVALWFLVVWAVASGLLAFFPDDPVGTKTHGLARVHLVLAAVAFLAVVIGTRLASRALRSDPAWAAVAPLLTALSWGALIPILLLGRAHLRPHSLGGLYEKRILFTTWHDSFEPGMPPEAKEVFAAVARRTGPAGGAKIETGAWKEGLSNVGLAPLTERRIHFHHITDRDGMIAYYMSISSIAARPEAERNALRKQLESLVSDGDQNLSLTALVYDTHRV